MRGVHAAARRLDVGGHEALQFLLASLVGPALASLQTEVVLHVDFQSCVFFERRVGQNCRRLQASFAEASGALLADVAGDLLGRRGRHLAKALVLLRRRKRQEVKGRNGCRAQSRRA